jgi:nucleotide-binding universal stress UspA family protein
VLRKEAFVTPTITAPPRIGLRNILFATDLDLSAQAAQFCALDLARRYGAALYTVNVLPHLPFVEATEPDPEQIKAAAEQKLAALAEPFKGIKHKELVEQGEVPEVLSRLIGEYDIDLVVIGTGARTGLQKLLLGSVAEEVFRTAACPVLTVGPHVTHWEIDGDLRHILFATDFGPESVHALPYALSLAESNRARLTLLHVAPEPGVPLVEPEPGTMPILDPSEVMASGEKRLRALIPEGVELWHKPEYLVQFGRPAETILRSSAQDVDLIVLGVKRPAALTKHLGAGVAYKIACEAFCPVLSVGYWYHGRD